MAPSARLIDIAAIARDVHATLSLLGRAWVSRTGHSTVASTENVTLEAVSDSITEKINSIQRGECIASESGSIRVARDSDLDVLRVYVEIATIFDWRDSGHNARQSD